MSHRTTGRHGEQGAGMCVGNKGTVKYNVTNKEEWARCAKCKKVER